MLDDGDSFRSALLFDIQTTPHGGRGAFARSSIPKSTQVLSCSGPYARVILRKFKKEVCAWCFAYSRAIGKNKWSIKPEEKLEGKPKGGILETGLWFCSDECHLRWRKNSEIKLSEGAVWMMELFGAMERAGMEMAKIAEGNCEPPDRFIRDAFGEILSSLDSDDFKKEDMTREFLEKTWSVVEDLISKSGTKSSSWTTSEALNEFELDTAWFVLDGIAQKVIEDLASPCRQGNDTEQISSSLGAGLWADLLELQNNDLASYRSRPSTLASHIRIYRFLKKVVMTRLSSTLASGRPTQVMIGATEDDMSCSHLRQDATQKLRNYLSTPAFFRAVEGRDTGNVFGIWEMTPDDEESEMFGWGINVFGSYFNHDCTPNIGKRRLGRRIEFHTLRDIGAGEELCISYVDGSTTAERNILLEGDWFFRCRCTKCSTELLKIPPN